VLVTEDRLDEFEDSAKTFSTDGLFETKRSGVYKAFNDLMLKPYDRKFVYGSSKIGNTSLYQQFINCWVEGRALSDFDLILPIDKDDFNNYVAEIKNNKIISPSALIQAVFNRMEIKNPVLKKSASNKNTRVLVLIADLPPLNDDLVAFFNLFTAIRNIAVVVFSNEKVRAATFSLENYQLLYNMGFALAEKRYYYLRAKLEMQKMHEPALSFHNLLLRYSMRPFVLQAVAKVLSNLRGDNPNQAQEILLHIVDGLLGEDHRSDSIKILNLLSYIAWLYIERQGNLKVSEILQLKEKIPNAVFNFFLQRREESGATNNQSLYFLDSFLLVALSIVYITNIATSFKNLQNKPIGIIKNAQNIHSRDNGCLPEIRLVRSRSNTWTINYDMLPGEELRGEIVADKNSLPNSFLLLNSLEPQENRLLNDKKTVVLNDFRTYLVVLLAQAIDEIKDKSFKLLWLDVLAKVLFFNGYTVESSIVLKFLLNEQGFAYYQECLQFFSTFVGSSNAITAKFSYEAINYLLITLNMDDPQSLVRYQELMSVHMSTTKLLTLYVQSGQYDPAQYARPSSSYSHSIIMNDLQRKRDSVVPQIAQRRMNALQFLNQNESMVLEQANVLKFTLGSIGLSDETLEQITNIFITLLIHRVITIKYFVDYLNDLISIQSNNDEDIKNGFYKVFYSQLVKRNMIAQLDPEELKQYLESDVYHRNVLFSVILRERFPFVPRVYEVIEELALFAGLKHFVSQLKRKCILLIDANVPFEEARIKIILEILFNISVNVISSSIDLSKKNILLYKVGAIFFELFRFQGDYKNFVVSFLFNKFRENMESLTTQYKSSFNVVFSPELDVTMHIFREFIDVDKEFCEEIQSVLANYLRVAMFDMNAYRVDDVMAFLINIGKVNTVLPHVELLLRRVRAKDNNQKYFALLRTCKEGQVFYGIECFFYRKRLYTQSKDGRLVAISRIFKYSVNKIVNIAFIKHMQEFRDYLQKLINEKELLGISVAILNLVDFLIKYYGINVLDAPNIRYVIAKGLFNTNSKDEFSTTITKLIMLHCNNAKHAGIVLGLIENLLSMLHQIDPQLTEYALDVECSNYLRMAQEYTSSIEEYFRFSVGNLILPAVPLAQYSPPQMPGYSPFNYQPEHVPQRSVLNHHPAPFSSYTSNEPEQPSALENFAEESEAPDHFEAETRMTSEASDNVQATETEIFRATWEPRGQDSAADDATILPQTLEINEVLQMLCAHERQLLAMYDFWLQPLELVSLDPFFRNYDFVAPLSLFPITDKLPRQRISILQPRTTTGDGSATVGSATSHSPARPVITPRPQPQSSLASAPYHARSRRPQGSPAFAPDQTRSPRPQSSPASAPHQTRSSRPQRPPAPVTSQTSTPVPPPPSTAAAPLPVGGGLTYANIAAKPSMKKR